MLFKKGDFMKLGQWSKSIFPPVASSTMPLFLCIWILRSTSLIRSCVMRCVLDYNLLIYTWLTGTLRNETGTLRRFFCSLWSLNGFILGCIWSKWCIGKKTAPLKKFWLVVNRFDCYFWFESDGEICRSIIKNQLNQWHLRQSSS